MNNVGWLYISPHFYSLGMRLLYGKYYENSYKQVVKLIPNNSSVVDVCCGDGKLYNYLKKKNIVYICLDSSKPFINFLKNKGVDARLTDVSRDPIPQADYIILQRSLYQFKNQDKLIKKLLKSTKKTLIISESIQNLGDNTNSLSKRIIHKIVPYFVSTHYEDKNFRFSEKGFRDLMDKYKPKYKKISGGKDLVALISKSKNSL